MFGKLLTREAKFDRWCGDASAPALRRSLEKGDVGPLASAYECADAHRREFLIQTLTLDLPVVPAIERWPEQQPDSALAFLARGAQGISSAWTARGRGYSETVDRNAWRVFFARLEQAEVDLHRAVELDDDGVAWSQLLASGRGRQLTTDELRARYSHATQLNPRLAFAADQLLQSLCEKWYGSHDEMFAFARETTAAAPDADPRHRLIAIAYYERATEFRKDVEGSKRYRDGRRAQADIIAAAERSALSPGFGTTPQHMLTVNWFAFTLCHFRRFAEARPLFERIGNRPTQFPWSYFTTSASAVFLDYRRQARRAHSAR